MTINEAVQKFKRSPTRIRKLVKAGRIPGAKFVEFERDGKTRLTRPQWFIPDTLKVLPVADGPGYPKGRARGPRVGKRRAVTAAAKKATKPPKPSARQK